MTRSTASRRSGRTSRRRGSSRSARAPGRRTPRRRRGRTARARRARATMSSPIQRVLLDLARVDLRVGELAQRARSAPGSGPARPGPARAGEDEVLVDLAEEERLGERGDALLVRLLAVRRSRPPSPRSLRDPELRPSSAVGDQARERERRRWRRGRGRCGRGSRARSARRRSRRRASRRAPAPGPGRRRGPATRSDGAQLGDEARAPRRRTRAGWPRGAARSRRCASGRAAAARCRARRASRAEVARADAPEAVGVAGARPSAPWGRPDPAVEVAASGARRGTAARGRARGRCWRGRGPGARGGG